MSKQIPKIEESTKFNFITSIWIVPLMALFIAGWLAYQYFANRGPEINIIFPKNEGLVAGKSVVKFKNVPIGKVTNISIKKDIEGVIVSIRMDSKATRPYLTEYAKFWIVKPEVGISGVSGLDTILSGTYIDVYSKRGGSIYKDEYVGLLHPYRDDSKGEYFVLNTPQGNSAVKAGTPIYFKNIKVGQVEYVVLGLDNMSIDVIVFIENDYTPYLRTDSSFWVRSTFDVGFDNGKLNLSVAPFTDLIQGAIEFSSQKKESNCTVPNKFVFKLYMSKSEVENAYIGDNGNNGKMTELYTIKTREAVAKLHVGAPIRYEGFQIGKVKKIQTIYDKHSHVMQSNILSNINVAAFSDREDRLGQKNFEEAIKEGLRAQIIPSDPITGFLYVDLTFNHPEDNLSIAYENGMKVLPTVAYHSGNMMASVTAMLDKINKLPLEKLLISLDKVLQDSDKVVNNVNGVVGDTGKVIKGINKPLTSILKELETTVSNLNKMTNKKSFSTMPNEVNKTLAELKNTLKVTKKVMKGYNKNSLITHQIAETLKVVTQTSKEMQVFLKLLNRKPNSLIFGDK